MVFEKVRRLLSEQLEIDEDIIAPETNIIADLGADSLDVVELIMCLEEEFSVVITDEVAGTLVTVGQVTDYISKLI